MSTSSSCTPYVAGHEPYLLEGVPLELQLVDRTEFPSGAVAMRYVAR